MPLFRTSSPRSPSKSFFVLEISTSNVSTTETNWQSVENHQPDKYCLKWIGFLFWDVNSNITEMSHTKVTVIDSNKLNSIYLQNAIHFPFIMHLRFEQVIVKL